MDAKVTATSYRCCCGSDRPSSVLTLFARKDVGELPEFKLRMPFAGSASSSGAIEDTLCGYVADTFRGTRFYRLVYRRGENGSGVTLPPVSASARPHADDIIEDTIDAEQENRRLFYQKCGHVLD